MAFCGALAVFCFLVCLDPFPHYTLKLRFPRVTGFSTGAKHHVNLGFLGKFMAPASSRAFLKRTLQKATGSFAVRKQGRGSCNLEHAAKTLFLIGAGTAWDARNLDF